jgi:holliday junction DNA helicase RuvB
MNDNFSLRPQHLKEYIGQEQAVKTLRMFLDAVKMRGNPSEHILFYGPPGIGKTTLSTIIANELQGEIKITTGAAMQKGGDLAAILTSMKDNDVLFIDEIHRLPRTVEEMMYPVLEEYALDIIIGKGPSARTVRLPIPKITIVGATTKLANLTAPLRDRFGLLLRLDYYTEDEMVRIIHYSAGVLELTVDDQAARGIAKRARKTPRLANRILKRARDVAQLSGVRNISHKSITELFDLLEIDDMGLTEMDKKYLLVIGKTFQNQPIGIDTLASSLSEDRRTIEEFLEPYLIQIGFIQKTPRGRILTPDGLEHMSLPRDRGTQQ